jgi:hypothetical protein
MYPLPAVHVSGMVAEMDCVEPPAVTDKYSCVPPVIVAQYSNGVDTEHGSWTMLISPAVCHSITGRE